jgi:Domain of unknown function (DUF4129)
VRSGVESRSARCQSALIVSLAAALVAASLARAAEPPVTNPTATDSDTPSRAEIQAAVEKLRADPNLGTTVKKRELKRNKEKEAAQVANPHAPSWLKWISDAFGWLASTARLLVWVIAILLAGILGLFIKRFIESRGERSRPVAFSMPTHVQDLDIRPESLPNDIGGAALELWERGEHRAALALLYRGLLSRMAHVHGVRIRDSSTEGDCLALATQHLPSQQAAYAARLIRLWQGAVYGNIEPPAEEFRAISVGFATTLDSIPTAAPVEQAA